MNDLGILVYIIFIAAVVFIVGGVIWFLATLGPIPSWGWLIIIGIAILTILYIALKAFHD
jgi:hypothetical protein